MRNSQPKSKTIPSRLNTLNLVKQAMTATRAHERSSKKHNKLLDLTGGLSFANTGKKGSVKRVIDLMDWQTI